jgi:DNA-directed RNA polymerase subunit E'/Rpb7
VAAKYPEGTKVKGKVVSITDYGVFVELEGGVEGFVPTRLFVSVPPTAAWAVTFRSSSPWPWAPTS